MVNQFNNIFLTQENLIDDVIFYNNTDYNCYIFGREILSGMIFYLHDYNFYIDRYKILIKNDEVKKILNNVFTFTSVNNIEALDFIKKNNVPRKFRDIYIEYKEIKYSDFLNNDRITSKKEFRIDSDVIWLHNFNNKIEILSFVDNEFDNIIDTFADDSIKDIR